MELTVLGEPGIEGTQALTLERRADGRLWAVRGDSARAVWVRRCFPWSDPERFLSLRDDAEEEFALVRDPAELDAESRGVLEAALVAAGFVFAITRVVAIDEEVEIRHWRGGTRPGGRAFSTRLVGPARRLAPGDPLIFCAAGGPSHPPPPPPPRAGKLGAGW